LRLKSLELQGFKSFPDKTVLQFTSGVTAVLGPNGSGKSNISDAVRWVLGELSSKSLRGNRMEDVIFGGSDTRRPMSYAEVTLVLDNSSPTSRLASEHDEVTVTRRYFRSGTSEYFINRRPVRLRDISELFLNTGLGKSGYSIIGQGKIAEIISQKSEDRRRIFEEAAGIAKYRHQKADAEKKLSEVDENCRNLSGILGELTKRVRQLERDSEKARIYVGLFDEKKQLDVSLWLGDNDRLRARYEEAQKQYIAAKLGLDNADSEAAELERQENKLIEALASCKDRLEENERALAAIRSRGRDLESNARVLENDLLHDSQTLEKTRTEQSLRQTALAEEEAKGLTLARTDAERRALSAKAESALTEQQGVIEEKKRQLTDIEEQMEQLEQEMRKQQEDISALRIRLSSLEGSHLSDGDRISDLSAQSEQLRAERDLILARMEKAEQATSGYDAMIAEIDGRIGERRARIAACDESSEAKRSEIARLQADVSAKQQRIDALKRMEELFEGYAQSVRFLMNAAERGRLSGILGPVARLISVEPKYVVAIETALGANLQNVVVENEDSAKAAIALLKQSGAGRCTFYPITSVRPSTLNLSPAERKALPGYLGVGDELCGFDRRYADILSSMLGRTLIFTDLETATAAAKKTSYRYRMVTLDGQIINAGGSFTGGSARKESGMLTRSAEIDRLKKAESEASQALVAEKKAFDALRAEMEALRQESEGDEGQRGLLSTLSQAEKTQYEVLCAQKDSLDTRLSDLERELASLGEQSESFSRTHRALSEEIEAEVSRGNELSVRQDALQLHYAEQDELLAQAESTYQALLLEKAGRDKDLEVTEQAIAFHCATLDALHSQIETARCLIGELIEKQKATREALEKNSVGAAELDGEEQTLSENGRALIAEQLGLEQKQSAHRETVREKARIREVLFRDFTRLESTTTQMKNDLDGMATRLWEEYELTYTTAAALSYPTIAEQDRPAASARREELRQQIKKLGHVNPAAIEEYQTEKERCDFLTAQLDDLTSSRENLSGIVSGLEKEMHARFTEAVTQIGTHFRAIFRELFGGGNAEIRLEDPDNALECGIEIFAAPPGKIIKSMTLLSGGEQSFTAIALIFAILRVNPTPFCIFDEIEAALDEVNVGHFAEYMKRYTDTQFIVITHRRGTMESADRIYGISMPERGISKVLGMNVGEIESKLGVSLS